MFIIQATDKQTGKRLVWCGEWTPVEAKTNRQQWRQYHTESQAQEALISIRMRTDTRKVENFTIRA